MKMSKNLELAFARLAAAGVIKQAEIPLEINKDDFFVDNHNTVFSVNAEYGMEVVRNVQTGKIVQAIAI